ncbi:MAG: methyltransferase domain-containing protein [ANME-2 cluster archaeon]|nr:methyltransferase domain-containing protein [ANME-2 cluster archaeon]
MTNNVEFSNIAAIYEHFSLVQRSAAETLLKLLDIHDSDDVLDLGCGTGNLTAKIWTLTNGNIMGIDPSVGMINEAIGSNKGLDIDFEMKSAEEMDHKDSLEVIFCNSAFQWFKEKPN